MAERLSLFATAARGTEDLLAEELAELGIQRVRQDRGGVRFSANLYEALRVCVWTRIALRVLHPLAEGEARGAEGVYDVAAAVPWEEHLTAHTPFAVEATLRDSEHTHSGFVALKIKDALVDRLRGKLGARPDVDTRNPAVRVVAHLAKEHLSLSLDLCGESLHRRGYRVAQTEAPLKETLAAAMLRAAGYKGDEPLFDPMCGSGTLLLEGAAMAAQRAPSLERKLGVERWPHLGARAKEILADVRTEARARLRPPPAPIAGMDKEEEAVAAARRNASAAHFGKQISLAVGDATGPFEPPAPAGLLVTNPPYGARLSPGHQKGIKAFYFKLGERLSALDGWRMA
ncbi:MAG TPA: THUMP domain-containing protein, partial [Myxococcaceae bacterium]|nr:THUMP domain-containing protein [Myxococcaceae bacterium]